MTLFDKLTTEDKQCIKDYITSHTDIDDIPDLSKTLSYWSKSKTTLYKLLGKQFRYSIPLEYNMSPTTCDKKLEQVFKYFYFSDFYFYTKNGFITDVIKRPNSYKYEELYKNQHLFINKLIWWYFELKEQGFSRNALQINFDTINSCLRGGTLFNNRTSRDYRIFKLVDKDERYDKYMDIDAGAKPLKVIRRILGYLKFPYMNLFQDFCDKISVVTTTRKVQGNLVFSIHPIDYMTMSNNNSGWSSCMAWPDGSYSNGTIEMMNSNIAVVAYLEDPHEYIVEGHKIPNKMWRSLYYINKDIICTGKSYPFTDYSMSRMILGELAKLAKQNLHWDYKFKDQEYKDMLCFSKNERIRCDYNPKEDKKKHIVLYTYAAMYNDLSEDREYKYYCDRNPVKKAYKLCMSGPATCLVCGLPISEVEDMNHSRDECCSARGKIKYCFSCQTKYYSHNKLYPTKDFYVIPEFNIVTDYFTSGFIRKYLVDTKYIFGYNSIKEDIVDNYIALKYNGAKTLFYGYSNANLVNNIGFMPISIYNSYRHRTTNLLNGTFEVVPITDEILEGYKR